MCSLLPALLHLSFSGFTLQLEIGTRRGGRRNRKQRMHIVDPALEPHKLWPILTTTNSCLSSIPSLSISAKSQILPRVSKGSLLSIRTPFTLFPDIYPLDGCKLSKSWSYFARSVGLIDQSPLFMDVITGRTFVGIVFFGITGISP